MTSLATAYKTVTLLKEIGEVLELGFGNDSNRHDGNKPYPHPHLICTKCWPRNTSLPHAPGSVRCAVTSWRTVPRWLLSPSWFQGGHRAERVVQNVRQLFHNERPG